MLWRCKRTQAVRLGAQGSLALALARAVACTPLSAATSPTWEAAGVAGGAYAGIPQAVVRHAVLPAWLLDRPVALRDSGGRIAHLMANY